MKAGTACLVGDSLAQWLAGRMRMDIDQTRHDHTCTAVNFVVKIPFVTLDNSLNSLIAENHIDITSVLVTVANPAPGHHPRGAANDGRFNHFKTFPENEA